MKQFASLQLQETERGARRALWEAHDASRSRLVNEFFVHMETLATRAAAYVTSTVPVPSNLLRHGPFTHEVAPPMHMHWGMTADDGTGMMLQNPYSLLQSPMVAWGQYHRDVSPPPPPYHQRVPESTAWNPLPHHATRSGTPTPSEIPPPPPGPPPPAPPPTLMSWATLPERDSSPPPAPPMRYATTSSSRRPPPPRRPRPRSRSRSRSPPPRRPAGFSSPPRSSHRHHPASGWRCSQKRREDSRKYVQSKPRRG